MASEEHKELSRQIKDVHERLREEAKVKGAQEAWQDHCSDHSTLKNYADWMRRLATEHWKLNDEACRIAWVTATVRSYFTGQAWAAGWAREVRLLQSECTISPPPPSPPYLLLDVGSCFNPFRGIPDFDVTGVDLWPGVDSVLRCDFLSVALGQGLLTDAGVCLQLPLSHYHVLVASLLLEYLPSPHQRYEVCYKAWEVLQAGGLLVIISPDSKHSTANSKLAREWREVLASAGFLLVSLHKLRHVRCSAYRRCSSRQVASAWRSSNLTTRALRIPQDTSNVDCFEPAGQDFSNQTRLQKED